MKYATWIIKRPEGTTPEELFRELGLLSNGFIMLDESLVLGYLSDEVLEENYLAWNLSMITQEKALELAQEKNIECFLTDDGMITSPLKL